MTMTTIVLRPIRVRKFRVRAIIDPRLSIAPNAPRVVTGSASRCALIASGSVRTFSCGEAIAQRRRTITNACENLCITWRGSVRQIVHVPDE